MLDNRILEFESLKDIIITVKELLDKIKGELKRIIYLNRERKN